MRPRTRYHSPEEWPRDRGDVIRDAAGALARLLGVLNRRGWRCDAGWQPHQPQRWWRGEPRWFDRMPPRPPFQRSPWARQQEAPRTDPRDWRPRVLPRRGPPVAAIRTPRWRDQEERTKRRPRGSNPRGPLRGGPERPADDPQRKPQGGLVEAPEGQLMIHRCNPSQRRTTQPSREEEMKREKTGRPTIITVDGKGKEQEWGPLSRANAWKAGFF